MHKKKQGISFQASKIYRFFYYLGGFLLRKNQAFRTSATIEDCIVPSSSSLRSCGGPLRGCSNPCRFCRSLRLLTEFFNASHNRRLYRSGRFPYSLTLGCSNPPATSAQLSVHYVICLPANFALHLRPFLSATFCKKLHNQCKNFAIKRPGKYQFAIEFNLSAEQFVVPQTCK